ncbi:MAG: GDP-mannose 4,6-dehydratase [Candidatus Nanopelagicaceae bacterium]
MKFLITGGAGFIGSHLAGRLLENGDEVVVLDDLSTGSKKNIERFLTDKRFEFVEGNMLDKPTLERASRGIDGIFHLGAALGVKRILERPLESLITNLHGTEAVLEVAASMKVKTFIASTSELYGKNPEQPLREDSDRVIGSPLLVRWTYSEAKAIDESLAVIYGSTHGLPFVIGRFFNTVGPKQTGAYGMVLPAFVKSALLGTPIQVYGDGSQSRVFCHVDDAVDGMMRVFFDDRALGQAFNIGGNGEVTISRLAEIVLEETGSKSQIEYVPYEKAYPKGFEDTMRRIPDTTKIRELTGWEPKKDLRKIIQDVAAHIRSEI